MNAQPTIFENSRSSIAEAIQQTAESLIAYGSIHRRWSLAFSGGKDSSTLLTLVIWLVESGQVPADQFRPESLGKKCRRTRHNNPEKGIAA